MIYIFDKWLYPEYTKNAYQSITHTTQFKMCKTLRYFMKKDTTMASEHLNKCLKSFSKYKIKTTIRYHIIPMKH